MPRSLYYYRSIKDDTAVIEALQELAFKHPSYGFRKLFAYIRRSGKNWNHKKVYRVYKLLKLNRKRKGETQSTGKSKTTFSQTGTVKPVMEYGFYE